MITQARQYDVLQALGQTGRTTALKLADHMGMVPAEVVPTLNDLRDSGSVYRDVSKGDGVAKWSRVSQAQGCCPRRHDPCAALADPDRRSARAGRRHGEAAFAAALAFALGFAIAIVIQPRRLIDRLMIASQERRLARAKERLAGYQDWDDDDE